MKRSLTMSQGTGAGSSEGHPGLWDGHGEGPFLSEPEDEYGEPEWERVDLGGFPTGLDLVGVCLRTVRSDPEIILLHALSFTLSISLLVLYIGLVLGGLEMETVGEALETPVFYFSLFPYLIVAVAVTTFFRAASIAIATIRLEGGDPVVEDGLRAAGRRIHLIVAWAFVAAAVGLVFGLLRSRSKGLGRIAVDGANLAWNVATYFVVPVMVFENAGPLEAVDRSTSIVRRTWREGLAGNFGLGFTMLLLAVPGLLLLPVGNAVGGVEVGVGLVVAYLVFLAVVFSAVGSVMVAALYSMARTGKRPAGFEGYEDLRSALATIELVEGRRVRNYPDYTTDSSLRYLRR